MVSGIEIWLMAILSLAYGQADRAEQTQPDRRDMGDRRKHGPGVTALRSTGVAQPLAHLPPRTHPDLTPTQSLWGALGEESSGCSRDPETGLMALEATSQDKPNANKDTVKAVDQTQWGKPYRTGSAIEAFEVVSWSTEIATSAIWLGVRKGPSQHLDTRTQQKIPS